MVKTLYSILHRSLDLTKKYKWVMIYINTFIENYYIIKYLVVNANILYNLPVEKEEKEKDEMD